MNKSPAARWNRAARIAAIRERVAGMLYEAIRPRLLAIVKSLRERQPPHWHRGQWWIR